MVRLTDVFCGLSFSISLHFILMSSRFPDTSCLCLLAGRLSVKPSHALLKDLLLVLLHIAQCMFCENLGTDNQIIDHSQQFWLLSVSSLTPPGKWF